MSDKDHTIIQKGTHFDGAVTSECPITLSGKLQGRLEAPSLTVTSSGWLQGKVQVSDLNSQGEVSGEIHAEAVQLAGRVGDSTVIHADTLEVKLENPSSGLQVTFGNCELQVGQNTGGKGKNKKIETPETENANAKRNELEPQL